ncbi:uncharacterized protein BX664DRAFT_361051 [Halteromyces radiatus]|uniref:uncharacterized protein n=1 Tax=Halteromyces radiatus TaxID=101107 RepID=UPI00221F431F|nr:uncharacterized protein BX664DRAFT_361051 [Halteromyces radiatus]KAI8082750.1 hypothetical protein BX664DRAFT_361051 [Halteromyces radiatus]
MDPPSYSISSSSNDGPRPLAVKQDFHRRLHTSKAGLLASTTSSNTTGSTTTNLATPQTLYHSLNHFNFKRPIQEGLLQPNAKRAKKVYRSILRDQHFLFDLKRLLWDKLKQLQMEHSLLEQMCQYTQQDVDDVPPLFSQHDIDSLDEDTAAYQQSMRMEQEDGLKQLNDQCWMQTFDSPYDTASTTTTSNISLLSPIGSSVYETADEIGSDTRSVIDTLSLPPCLEPWSTTKSEEMTPTHLDTIEENTTTEEPLDQYDSSKYQDSIQMDDYLNNDNNNTTGFEDDDYDDDDDDDDNVEDEDEETARKALTFMLAHYGNDF